MNNQAAIYARVSTDDQAERGYSLPSQIEACQSFAEQNDLDVIAVYKDDISGVKPMGNRPEGSQLLRAINAGQVNVVIVYQVDRLSRNLIDSLVMISSWRQLGIVVYLLDIGQVKDEHDLNFLLKAWQGSDERIKILERTSRGRYSKARAGKAVGTGTPPFGYTYQNGELSIEESQAQIVRLIFDLYLNGDEHGSMMSLNGIAKRLTSMGIPTPSEIKGWHKRRVHKGVWLDSAVNWILSSETYCGVLRYGKFIGAGGRGGKRPQEDHITIPVPAIVTREMWELVQERKSFNSRVARRRMKREYLLRGLIRCGCGRNMVGTKGRYYCTRRNHYYELDKCNEPLVPGCLIETLTWDYIMGLIQNPAEFEEKLRLAQAREGETMQPKQIEYESILALLEQTEEEAEVIAFAIRKNKGIVKDNLERQADEVNERYQAMMIHKQELEESLTYELTDDTINNLLRFREIVAQGLDSPTFEDKRNWLEILQVTVTVTNRMAVITCRLDGDDPPFDLGDPSAPQGGGGLGPDYEHRTLASSKTERRRKFWRRDRKSKPDETTGSLQILFMTTIDYKTERCKHPRLHLSG